MRVDLGVEIQPDEEPALGATQLAWLLSSEWSADSIVARRMRSASRDRSAWLSRTPSNRSSWQAWAGLQVLALLHQGKLGDDGTRSHQAADAKAGRNSLGRCRASSIERVSVSTAKHMALKPTELPPALS